MEYRKIKESESKRNKRDTLYIVKTESQLNAKETAYEILERLIMKKAVGMAVNIGRTCCLRNNGGQE